MNSPGRIIVGYVAAALAVMAVTACAVLATWAVEWWDERAARRQRAVTSRQFEAIVAHFTVAEPERPKP